MTPVEWCRMQQAGAKAYIDTHQGAYVAGAEAYIRDAIMEEVILLTLGRERDDKES